MEKLSASLTFGSPGPPGTGGFPDNGPVMQSFDDFLKVNSSKPLNKQSSYQWFETQRYLCDITVMWGIIYMYFLRCQLSGAVGFSYSVQRQQCYTGTKH